MKSNSVLFGSLVASILASGAILTPFPAQSQESKYEYAWSPGGSPGGNLIYRVDKTTGEMHACVYDSTNCYGPGDGAGPEAPGDYGIVATTEGRVIRMNKTTGDQSICNFYGGRRCCCSGTKVCTTQGCQEPPP